MSDASRNYNAFKQQPTGTKKVILFIAGFFIGICILGLIFRGCA